MAVVDILISKTFDASVICPAEQTCVIDDAIYDDVVAEFERMGARVLAPDEVGPAARTSSFGCDGGVNLAALGQPAGVLGRAGRASRPPTDDKVLLAPLPADLGDLAAHPLVHEKLMPVLGLVRVASGRARRHRGLRARHRARRPRAHLGGLRPRRSGRRPLRRAASAPAASS